ncbi:uncharacterized protein SCHCODRAFT_02626086 [Schizophyllum commune H4-8]|uniref:uncharacterized protein n=1 Tax=Schizophyllum commune (strain H4-8 / FGSC 9210) TaxID=578458 RepID=UPI00215FBA2E|nr:uncharacterized protein SCHCODRAFT_02626086 [Schizophyllum commune H4-8]KAI5892405.1 hypothetical protein SCHCODRAFT_02626086 [Schizophyllum commune H4-8]
MGNGTVPLSSVPHMPRPGEDVLPVDAFRGTATACMVWVIWDWLISLDREVRAVWQEGRNLPKLLYVFIRYHTIGAMIFYFHHSLYKIDFQLINLEEVSDHLLSHCLADAKRNISYRWYMAITQILSITVGEALVLLRINALYGWSRRLMSFTVALFVAEAVVGIVTTCITLTGGSEALLGSSEVLNCTADAKNMSDVNIAMWCTSMIVVCVYFVLVVLKTSSYLREIMITRGRYPLLALARNPQAAPALYTCVRDASMYFLLAFTCVLMNLLLNLLHSPYVQVGSPWLVATYGVTSSKIFLNLKEVGLQTRMPLSMSDNFAGTQSMPRFRILDAKQIVHQ